MPTYEYQCKSCGHKFEDFLPIKDREKPTKCPCPECEEKKVKQGFFTSPVGGFDSQLKPHPAFKEIMHTVKNNGSVPKKYHENIDKAVDRTGGRYKTQ